MSARIEQIINDIEDLIGDGEELHIWNRKESIVDLLFPLVSSYEIWYTKALTVVKQIIPDRVSDFERAYKTLKRKDIDLETYSIRDFLDGLSITHGKEDSSQIIAIYTARLASQIAILKSAYHVAPSVLRNMRLELRAELIDSDISTAKELLESGHLRSAGAICGVVLESHFKIVVSNHSIKISRKNPAISDFNDKLKGDGVIDVTTWRQIQRLGDIRNLCVHSKDREPTKSEVEDLISGTEKITKEVF